MKKIVLIFLLLFSFFWMSSQMKTPAVFRWQDKVSKKHVKKYLHHDTLLQTSEATLHISYNNDSLKPYLLLLHGMGSNARNNWYAQIKTLSKVYNLILPDLIYFGESTSLTQNVSAEFQAQQIQEAILKLGITKKINIMGFSYGGLVTALYNQFYNDQVNKLIIVDSPVKFFSGEMADSLAKSVGVNTMNNVVVPTTIQEFDGMQKAVMSSAFPISKNMKRKLITYFFGPTKEIRNKQMNYLTEHQITYQNYNYNLDKTPTLLIWGGKDGVVPVSVGIFLHKAYPNSKLIIYPNAKHDSHFSETKKLNKAVIEFINQ